MPLGKGAKLTPMVWFGMQIATPLDPLLSGGLACTLQN